MAGQAFRPMKWGSVRLLPGTVQTRFQLNRAYMMSLDSGNLLQNFYLEAGLWQPPKKPDACHWGWESPTSQVRGHFLGHWLSGAARTVAGTGDAEMKAKADRIVAEIARCQKENGGEWAGSIPEKYLDWVVGKKQVWAPHYTVHKTLMGLLDMHSLAGNAQALDILLPWARWFHRWTGRFTRTELDDILDVETGGMLEAWADLYGLTGLPEHRELMERYDRPRLFDRLLAGEDALTNKHANTTIPEAQGAARAWEVTGEKRWRDIAEAYWRQAVTERGAFCTGGQTEGEIWTPKGSLAARLGDKNQEHCTVYNMMRLAEYLQRWTGDAAFADYWERNLYNGILAQQHPATGQVSYFLPLKAGSRKKWGTPTEDFWCCHGTLVQAHPGHAAAIYYQTDEGLAVCQHIPSALDWSREGAAVRIVQTVDPQTGETHRPRTTAVDIGVECDKPASFTLAVRVPWWAGGEPFVTVNGERGKAAPSGGFLRISRRWGRDRVRVEMARSLRACPLPDRPDMAAFLDGPVVLAGLCGGERLLRGDIGNPETFLAADNEREWDRWLSGYRTVGQENGLSFRPLHEIADEAYTVYFPVTPRTR